MSDKFQPVSMEHLCAWVFGEWHKRRSIFGVPEELMFRPAEDDPFRRMVYGRRIETPFGVAAGPHSQMAQNIIVSWLHGARFIELKTVQTLDELNVSKPCIDMQDAGYNVEWSQELKVHESYAEYLRAWVLIHVLHRRFGFPGAAPGLVFNMSVGYDMKGILQPNVQDFLARMRNAEEDVRDALAVVARHWPEAADIPVPSDLSNNVTLSTMHGCPPEEIGTISAYLMKECGLHTSVKLNPTLLGPHRLREILNRRLGYVDVEVPDEAFGHDLKYDDAVRLLKDLRRIAADSGVEFGVKLSNTLEVVNRRGVFASHEKMMYLSGRPLHALTVNLAAQLDAEFGGELPMSFAGGADAFNVEHLLASGMNTVTVCSDLLRSGGYARLLQYIGNTRAALEAIGARNLDQFCCKRARRTYAFAASLCAEEDNHRACPRLNLKDYAEAVLSDPACACDTFDRRRTKTIRPLGPFDCIKAPCTDECPVNQKVPEYMALVREGRWEEAARLTREDNPLPTILGRACNHLCENVCVRTHYDEPLAIREIKRAIMDHETAAHLPVRAPARPERVAIVGAGPCGLSVAYFLALAGYAVELFESRPYAGGMVSGTIPGYRAAMDKVRYDMDLVLSLGAKVHYGCKVGRDVTLSGLREQGFAAIVVAVGAQKVGRLGIEGEDGEGVYDALTFLRASREKKPMPLGREVAVIGGGDVAMDCARTASRLGADGVRIVYRRTRHEMPASREELAELLEEKVPVVELAAPTRIVRDAGRVTALECVRMELGEPDDSGRRRPVEIPDSTFNMPVDQVIVAVTQLPDLALFDGDERPEVNASGYLKVDEAMRTTVPDVYAGGDIGPDGPASIVKALGDGRRIAASIREQFEGASPAPARSRHGFALLNRRTMVDLLRRRATRATRVPVPRSEPDRRTGFDEVVFTLDDSRAQAEAGRCLDCHKICSYCVGVCPNMAMFTYANNFSGTWMMPVLSYVDGAWITDREEKVSIGQRYQVAVFADFCNECGNCATFCPAAGKPYRDKPRFYLDRAAFEAETDNAYRIVRRGRSWTIEARIHGRTGRLRLAGQTVEVEVPGLAATLEPATLELKDVRRVESNGTKEISLAPVAGMWVMLNAIREELPFFPVADEPV